MIRTLLTTAVAAVLVITGAAIASQPTEEGDPNFGIDVRYEGKVTVGQPLRLLVGMSGLYAPGTPMQGRIVLPRGVELVSGELIRSATASNRAERWVIVVRPTRSGTHRIVATFDAVVNAQERDEGDFVLTLDTAAATEGGVSWRTRSEKVLGAQRYRYGGDFLVPIDGPEDFNQNDILKSGQKLETISSVAASCPECGKNPPAAVSFVVFVDKSGRLVDARALCAWTTPAGCRPPLPATDPAAVAARRALAAWKFRPSRVAGRPVADWQVVKVAVHPPQ